MGCWGGGDGVGVLTVEVQAVRVETVGVLEVYL